MILLDLAEWVVNLLVFSMSLVVLTMVMFIVSLIIYSIHDWRGK